MTIDINTKYYLDVTVEDGKYRVIMNPCPLQALRYNKSWRDCAGDNLILALASEIRYLRNIIVNSYEGTDGDGIMEEAKKLLGEEND